MLKIRDDIDLKELEKFGFEKYEPLFHDYFRKHDNYFITVSARYNDKYFKDDGKISIWEGHINNMFDLYNGFPRIEDDVYEEYIQDLIQAGLVEKI